MFTEELEKKFYKQVGELIRSHRIRKEISHELLGKHVGLTRSSIINIENGRQKVLLHTLVAVAECLNVTITELIPLKQSTETDIDESVKIKITQKVSSEMQLNKFEDFIHLSLLSKPK